MSAFGDNPRRRSGVVPIETARKIARQRDELLEEVKRLRREKQELAEGRREDPEEIEAFEKRAEEAEAKAEQLEAELEKLRDLNEADEAGDEEKSERIGQLERRVANLTDDLRRVRSRAEKSAEEARREERMRLLSELGDVLDSVEQGLTMVAGEAEREGLEAIYAQLKDFFRREGASLTGEVGTEFDPRLHEAIQAVETAEYEPGVITDVARHGIVLEDGSVVLPAKVRVVA